tara:strand:- start:109 stop:216 length:108 start_codon:yes stop_codon:yes gene_type:complete
MIPWEREVYLDMLMNHLKEEQAKQDQQGRANGNFR